MMTMFVSMFLMFTMYIVICNRCRVCKMPCYTAESQASVSSALFCWIHLYICSRAYDMQPSSKWMTGFTLTPHSAYSTADIIQKSNNKITYCIYLSSSSTATNSKMAWDLFPTKGFIKWNSQNSFLMSFITVQPAAHSHFHWLPVHTWIQSKTALITYKTITLDQPIGWDWAVFYVPANTV